MGEHGLVGGTWEGFVLEKIIAEASPDHAYFWRTHNGAELDLLLFVKGRKIGVEIKGLDAPRRTGSMTVAVNDLRLDALYVVYPGEVRYDIDDTITAMPAGVPFSISVNGESCPIPSSQEQDQARNTDRPRRLDGLDWDCRLSASQG